MAVKLLVASPIVSFGELIRATLASHGDFEVKVCETGNQVLDAMAGANYDILILDAAINDQPFPPLVKKIVACIPDQKIAIVPPENNPDHPSLKDVPAHGFLFRPFLDPDLVNLVQRLASTAGEGGGVLESTGQGGLADRKKPWPEDAASAGAELSRLILGSSALAGMILREGRLFVHTGRISENGAEEIVQMLSQVKNDPEKDLVRFTFLVADDCEALVYGVSLISGWMLALVYDVSMPLTRVRSQAAGLASRLREQMPLEGLLESPGMETDAGGEEDGGVDISAIMQEINAREDLSTDEFLNLNTLDEELLSLINEVNQPKTPPEEPAKETESGRPDVPVDRLYTGPLKLPEGYEESGDEAPAVAGDTEGPTMSVGEEEGAPQIPAEPAPDAESIAARADAMEELQISDDDAAEMEAALSRLEGETGVVVGEDIPILAEATPEAESIAEKADGLEELRISDDDAAEMEAALSQLEGETGVVVGEDIPILAEAAPDGGNLAEKANGLEELRISDDDASDMEATLSRLEGETGVVVGEDIPILEQQKAAAPTGDADIDYQELAEGHITPETPPLAEAAGETDGNAGEAAGAAAPAAGMDLQQEMAAEITAESETPPPAAEGEETVQQAAVAPESEIQPAEAAAVPALEEALEPAAAAEPVLEAASEPVEIPPTAEASPDQAGEPATETEETGASGEQDYTLVFAPRVSGQFLTGELADHLGSLLKKTGPAFPWKLTGLAIRPEYLRLSLEISRHLEPADIIAFVKTYTDHAIRRQIPYSDQAMGGETFWAEEHLCIPNRSIPEGGQLREFLNSVKSESEPPS